MAAMIISAYGLRPDPDHRREELSLCTVHGSSFEPQLDYMTLETNCATELSAVIIWLFWDGVSL